MHLTVWNMVRHEERQSQRFIVFQAARTLAWQSHVFLLQLEILRVQNFLVIVHYDPEWL